MDKRVRRKRLLIGRYPKIYLTLILLCVGITLVMAQKSDKFVSVRNFANMGNQMAMTAVIAFAVTTVIIGRCTDLSTGANLALSAMVGALLSDAGVPAGVCMLAMVLAGTAIGILNGILVSYMNISPFIATFAMQQFARGLTITISKSSSIPVKNEALLWLGTAKLGAIPISIALTLLLCALWWVIMNRTLYGRYIYAMGGNFEAARASGINSRLVRMSTFLFTGTSVGLAAILYLGRVRSAQPSGGLGLEFDALTAVFVGGALVEGGAGTPIGALLGTLLVIIIKTAMNFFGVPQFVSYIVTGAFILLAVVIYQEGMIANTRRFLSQSVNDVRALSSRGNRRATDVDEAVQVKSSHVIELEGIKKCFSDFVALNNITTTIRSGEMIGLVGENGAGKSTLVNVLSGVFEPSAGTVKIDGKAVKFNSPQDSKDQGIGVIHQHYSLIPELDIAQNLFYNQEPRVLGMVQRGKMKRMARKLTREFHLDIPVETKVYQLTVGQRQLVEVVKATLMNPWLLIMDEPTSSLSKTESERLYELIDQVLKRNVAIVYISHKLDEIFKLCRRVIVLRDGNMVGEVAQLSDVTEQQLINMMVGRNIENIFPYTQAQRGDIALEVEHLSDGGLLKDVSFNVHHGELVVLAGLMGAGRTETIECIYGLRGIAGGAIRVNGRPVTPRSTKMIAHQVGFIPEDRHRSGIIPRMSIAHNATLVWHRLNKRGLLLDRRGERREVDELIQKVGIRPNEPKKETITLSGGNQQKVVVSKVVAVNPQIFLLDDPTRGIDVGAKSEIHQIIADYKKNGAAILLVSSELTEVLNVADRIYVMHNGSTVKELPHGTTENEIMYYAFGLQGGEGGAQ